jgi:hypothetical protein
MRGRLSYRAAAVLAITGIVVALLTAMALAASFGPGAAERTSGADGDRTSFTLGARTRLVPGDQTSFAIAAAFRCA